MPRSVFSLKCIVTHRKRHWFLTTWMDQSRLLDNYKLLINILSLWCVISQSCAYAEECTPLSTLDSNDLTMADITIKHQKNQLICVRAKFALAFNIEELVQKPPVKMNSSHSSNYSNITYPDYVHVGYLPIGQFKRVELNCPDTDDHYNTTVDGLKSFLMMADFGCGSFDFTFVRDDNSKRYLQTHLKGSIRFGTDITQDIEISKRMFLTSDLLHHFYYPDKIEVEARTNQFYKYRVRAEFFNSEFELFRISDKDQFVLPIDEHPTPIDNS